TTGYDLLQDRPSFWLTSIAYQIHGYFKNSFLNSMVSKPYLDQFIVVFIDDILIYSKTPQDH
ncbi:hypothetical protein AKJ16_DCAP21081, partial [Drosera capensis]